MQSLCCHGRHVPIPWSPRAGRLGGCHWHVSCCCQVGHNLYCWEIMWDIKFWLSRQTEFGTSNSWKEENPIKSLRKDCRQNVYFVIFRRHFPQRGAQPDCGDGDQGEGEQPRRLQRPHRQPMPLQSYKVWSKILAKRASSLDQTVARAKCLCRGKEQKWRMHLKFCNQ